ncbi:hypothetical protein [Aeromicrobium sp.]|uniref:hypothetical protein n=1 Tax=Aeromicrobium sp. TaxID=1871063 RepID=UPI003C4E13DD
MNGSDMARSLAIGRMVIGAVALLFPALAARLFLLNAKTNPQLPYMTRLFAAREIAVGAMTLTAPENARTSMVGLGMAIDGSDAVAGIAAARSGAVSKPVGFILAGAALGAVAAGASTFAGRS